MPTPAEIRAELAAGPQTQEALDQAFMKYTPAQLQAAYPEYGGVEQYNTAAQEAQERVERQEREKAREEMRGSGDGVRVANESPPPNQFDKPGSSALPKSEIDAARAQAQEAVRNGSLSQSAYNWMEWRQNEYDPMMQNKVGEGLAAKGVNPYNPAFWKMGEEQADRADRRAGLLSANGVPTDSLAPWDDPDYAAKQKARDDATKARDDKLRADWEKIPVGQRPVVGGGNVTPNSGGGGGNAPAPTTPTPTTPTPTTPTPTTPTPTNPTPTNPTPTNPTPTNPTPTTPTPPSPAENVPVYGPDGTRYPSAAAARAAGVYQFSLTPPVNPTPGTPPPTTTPPTTGVDLNVPAPQPGLITGNQLFTAPTSVNFPR